MIRDTNGAGDTFVGAFLAELSKGKTIETAIRSGHTLASQIIKTIGVKFGAKDDEKIDMESDSSGPPTVPGLKR